MKLRYKIGGGIVLILGLAVTALAITLSYNAPCTDAAPVSDAENSMKAVVYTCYGSPEVLQYTDVPKPVPAAHEVLVRVRAAAVNPLDWHYMRGEPYIMRLMGAGTGKPSDQRFGVDFAGEVEAAGSDVSGFKVGDAVFGGANGAFAEYVVVAEDRALALKPETVSFEQAAAVPIAALTALQSLRDLGQLDAGQKVLINGASGGVGTFAVQIAAAMGAEVTGVCSERNVDMVRSIGADHVFDYRKENYTESGNEYDLIVDMIGNHSLLSNRDVLAPDGRMVLVGGGKGNWLGPVMRPIKAALLSPFIDQEMRTILARLTREDLQTLAAMMAAGDVTPVIDRRYSLRELPAAVAYSEEGRARGKIIITVP